MRILPKSKFTWVLIIFVIYVYYQEYGHRVSRFTHSVKNGAGTNAVATNDGSAGTEEAPAPQNVPEDTFVQKVAKRIQANETGRVIVQALVNKAVEDKYGRNDIQYIAAKETSALIVTDSLYGAGERLNCGAKATINYEAFLSSGVKFDGTRFKDTNSPITLQTGGKQVIQGLEAGIVGMQVGGRRKIVIPPELGFDIAKFSKNLVPRGEIISYDVELMEIKDGPYKTTLNTNTLRETPGAGGVVLCSDKVKIKYEFTDSEGNILPGSSGEAEFLTGDGQLPIGIDMAVIGMQKNGQKTLSIPYPLLKIPGKSILPQNITFAENQPAIVNISVLSVNDK